MVYYGLLLFFALDYIRPGSYVPALNALHLNSIVPLSVLIGSLVSKGQVTVSEALSGVNARWIMYFLVLIVISALTCDVKQYAIDVLERVFGYCIIFFIIKKEIYDLDRMKGVFTALVLVHLIIGGLTPELFSGDGERHYIASGGFLGDGNDFALSVNIAIPLCLFLMQSAHGVIKKVFFAGALSVLIFGVVATQSRGGILALASVGLYYWFRNERKILGAIGLAVVVMFVFIVAPPQFFDRMGTMTQTGEEMEGSAQGRLLAWGAGVRMAMDHPLLGVGPGHYPVKYGAEYKPEGFGLNAIPWQTAHSSYFLLLGELGFSGLIFLLGIIGSNLAAGERTLREIRPRLANEDSGGRNLVVALNASLIAFMVGGAFLSGAYYPHIYVLAALLECGRAICNKSYAEVAVASTSENTLPL
ncbi:MAG: O-antigen ligase family protein, partial [Nitrospira sp.]|nr:O-antigen ligase family protein [Nitrospira sp.]